ncbi:hypothetical protein D3C86_1766060 [compost metagenome]
MHGVVGADRPFVEAAANLPVAFCRPSSQRHTDRLQALGPLRFGGVGHAGSNSSLGCAGAADRAMLSSTSRNRGGVALRMRVLSLPPTIAIIPMRLAFS